MCVVFLVYVFIHLFPFLFGNLQHFNNPKYSRHKKCCPIQLYFGVCRGNLTCIAVLSQSLEVAEETVANASECIEVLKMEEAEVLIIANQNEGTYREITDYITYPKCCPLNKNYDLTEHKCVPGEIKNFQGTGIFVTIGLRQCNFGETVIADYVNMSSHLDKNLRLQLQNGKSASYGMYCFDVDFKTGSTIVRLCQNYSEICRSIFETSGAPCLRKCCADGEVFSGASGRCYTTYDSGIAVLEEERFKRFNSTHFGIIQGTTGPLYKATRDHLFYINSLGELRIRVINHWDTHTSQKAPYCIETVVEGNFSKQEFFLIASNIFPHYGVGEILNQAFLNITIVFLFITIVCLYLIPDMPSLHSKCLIMYCFCDMMLYITINVTSRSYYTSVFYLRCHLILYFLMAISSWLNVLCADIYLTFRNIKTRLLSQNSRESKLPKKILYCNMYGWGVPTVYTLFIFVIWKTECLPVWIIPMITTTLCLKNSIANNYGFLVYVIVPYIISTLINVVFLLLTANCYRNIQESIKKLQDIKQSRHVKYRNPANKNWERTTSIAKLLLMTGIFRAVDLIGVDLDWTRNDLLTWVHIIWCSIGNLSGVCIFFILIVRKNSLIRLKQKLIGIFENW